MGTVHYLFPFGAAPQVPQPEDFVPVGSVVRKILARALDLTSYGKRLQEMERHLASIAVSPDQVREYVEGSDFWTHQYFIDKVLNSTPADWSKHPALYSAFLQEARTRFSWTPPPG